MIATANAKGTSFKPVYGALAHLYSGKHLTALIEKIEELGRNGLIDEYYDIKASEPPMDFKTAKLAIFHVL